MTSTVENLKKEISDCYIKDLKNQLGWFKSIAVLPIQKPIKNILIGKGELPEKFDEVKEFGRRKNIINFVSPNVANQIFDFMKNKRLEIENRKTESELIQLKNEILGLTPENSDSYQHQDVVETENLAENSDSTDENNGNTNSNLQETPEFQGSDGVTAGAETAVIGGASTLALEKIAAKNAKAIEQLSAPKLKSTIESVINITEKKRNALEHRLTSKQLKNVDKYIEKLKAGIGNIDTETVDLLKDWNKLGNKFKISKAILEQCGLTEKQLSQISEIADDLVNKPKHEIKAILESKGIKSIDDSIIEAFCKAENPTEIKMMTQILKHGNRIPRMLQTLAGALWVDVAFSGLDVWMYIEQKKEAELISQINKLRGENKFTQAGRQLGIGISSIAIEGLAIWLMGGAAAGGPIGVAVGLGVGALTMAASFGVDSLYFDVADFYLQNQEDYLRQKRSQLKQSILQLIYNKKQGNSSLNEHIVSFRSPSLKPGSEIKNKSLNDACVSMIFLEEIDEDGKFDSNIMLQDYLQSGKSKEDFLSDKDQEYQNEFQQIWSDMEDRINTRMHYVTKEFKKSDIIKSIKKGTGMQDLTKIFRDSRVYSELKESNNWDDSKTFNENLQSYKSELLSEFPNDKIKKLEDLRKNNRSLFLEIITTVSLDDFIYGEDEDEKNDNYDYVQNVKLVVAYKKRLQFTENIEDKEYLHINEVKNSKFIENLLKSDFDLDKTKYPTKTSERLIDLVSMNAERYGITNISENPLQNILYRLARELFGYSGENDMQGLMRFFSESNDKNHGIYYSDKRQINDDWAIDTKLINNLPELIHEKDIDKYVNNFMKSNFYTPNYDTKGNFIGFTPKANIDTTTESIDYKLNQEFRNKIETIVREEISNHTIENQKKVKNQISNFVSQHSNGGYVELPYFLIIEAKKAGLGDLQRQFFKRENNKLVICCLPSEVNNSSLFDNVEKLYISPARESFTKEEKYYIDRVESARKKIEKLRNLHGINLTGASFEDDLDIPIEIEHLISDKVNERKDFKENMLMYDGNIVYSIIEKCNEFATYFENLYKGILISLNGFNVSNDIDSFSLFSQSLQYGNQNIFDESGNLLNIEGNELLNDTEFKKYYKEQINTLKIGSKTIKELWNSDNKREKELAKQVSNKIYTTVLEFCLIDFDKDGNVKSIYPGTKRYEEGIGTNIPAGIDVTYSSGVVPKAKVARKDKRKIHKKDLTAFIVNRLNLKNMQLNPEVDINKINDLSIPQKIIKLNQQQRELTSITPKIQKEIENSMDDIDWRYKRDKIKYDPESSTLKSRQNEIKIILPKNGNIKTIQLEGLSLNLPIKEGLRLANFRNRVKYNYPNQKVEFGIDILNKSLSWRKTFVVNGTMLIARGDLEKYCSICKSDNNMESIEKWLNK